MKKIFMRLLPFLCLLGGVLFIVLGITNAVKQKNYTEETAVITRIAYDSTLPDDEIQYDVYVAYEVDGNSYESKLDSYNASMKVGDTVTVMVNPDNPSEIVTKGKTAMLLLIGFGVLSLFAGVVLFFKQLR